MKGGAVYQNDNVSANASTLILSSTISANTADYGGGIYNDSTTGGTLDLVNATVSGNLATHDGGGIYSESSASTTLANVTVTNNQADSDYDGVGTGGGIYNAGPPAVAIGNTILAGNYETVFTVNFGWIAHLGECTGAIFAFHALLQNYNTSRCLVAPTFVLADPKLDITLKSNGGRTPTYLPLAMSPAIDGGNPTGCVDQSSNPLTVDQRGVKRPIGSACDLGSVELEPEGDVNGDGVVDVADVFYLINFLFAGGPVPKGRANVNGDPAIDVNDVFYLINFLFAGGPPPM
jgi:parallel beta-helix repeat protein